MKLPRYKPGKSELYCPAPPQAGDYIIVHDSRGTVTASWDGQDWWCRGDKILTPKNIFEVHGPIPGTTCLTLAQEEAGQCEWLLGLGLVGLLQEAHAPGTNEQIEATIARLGARLVFGKEES